MSVNDLLFIRLYIDEDVHQSLTSALQQRGYDVLSVREVNRQRLSDTDQLAYAAKQNRTLFSFNATDYIELHLTYLAQSQTHAGIIVAKQIPIGETLRRLLILLDQVSVNEIHNQLHWLPSLQKT